MDKKDLEYGLLYDGGKKVKKDKIKKGSSSKADGDDSDDMVGDMYKSFVDANQTFWTWFNVSMFLLSALLLAANAYLIQYDNKIENAANKNNSKMYCGGLTWVLYCLAALHCLNMFASSLTFCGWEVKVCTGTSCCIYAFLTFVILAGVQVLYFNAMQNYCMSTTPILYYTVMGQILILYAGVGGIVCFFFRKNCQDDLEDEEARIDCRYIDAENTVELKLWEEWQALTEAGDDEKKKELLAQYGLEPAADDAAAEKEKKEAKKAAKKAKREKKDD